MSILFSLFAFGGVVSAVQPSAPSPIPAPLRELPWGQLNILHTTDTHGWHGGHLQEWAYPRVRIPKLTRVDLHTPLIGATTYPLLTTSASERTLTVPISSS